MDQRLIELKRWLEDDLSLVPTDLQPASEDASFRRYFRASLGEASYVVMDAPPPQESVDQFVHIAQALHQQGVHSPEVLSVNSEQGFLLLEDLGNSTYLMQLSERSQTLYTAALLSLLKIQQGDSAFNMPRYDHALIDNELQLFVEWYLGKHKNINLSSTQLMLWNETKIQLYESFQSQPQVWVHRDYHSRNLMITIENSPGVIDFQDMVLGPIAYDLASLFKDCYIEWPRQRQLSYLAEYYALVKVGLPSHTFEFEDLVRWYDFCGIQRHLKVLGVFCRLYYRDGKQQYLGDLPLVRRYLLEAAALYPQLSAFSEMITGLLTHDQ